MAIDLFSDNTNTITISPRISFSHEFYQSDTVPVEQHLRSFSSSSSADFNFSVQQNSDHHHADELFSDGKIIPTQIKQHFPPLPPPQTQPAKTSPAPANKTPVPVVDDEQQNSSKSSFWGFKRSSSCGNGYARSLCPIPLSRSNSTGSSASAKRSAGSKEGCGSKHHSKPPLRKTNYGYGNGNNNNTGNGVRVNPVLNLGFGSLFSSGKKK